MQYEEDARSIPGTTFLIMGRIVATTVHLQDLPLSPTCKSRLRKLSHNGRYQLLFQAKRVEGQIQILVWRVSGKYQFTEEARKCVPKLLLPTLILSEEDLFSIGEDHVVMDEEDEGLAPHEVPGFISLRREFDSDVYYNHV
jgi:hypothetical protein